MLKADFIASLLVAGDSPDASDPLVISPRPNLVDLADGGAASVDLRLGSWFVLHRQSRVSHVDTRPGSADVGATKSQYVPIGSEINLHPGGFILGATLEWVRLPGNLAAYVIGKSSLGRRGLIIATATGVHPGFNGCLTLELANVGELPVLMRPGMKICQICFHSVQTGQPSVIARSSFAGSRKPRLGTIARDSFAESLADAWSSRKR
ncbi:MAG: dCTP deaminase [Planctomycetes bacterium]|nr:dCTP deaminase [Planctomycetota bacterium]